MDGPAGGGYKYQQLPPIYTETDQSAIENRDRTNYAQGQSHVVIPVLGGNNDSNGYGTLIGNVQEGGGVYTKSVYNTDGPIGLNKCNSRNNHVKSNNATVGVGSYCWCSGYKCNRNSCNDAMALVQIKKLSTEYDTTGIVHNL